MAYYPVTDADGYVWATVSMSTVNNLLAASKIYPANIVADRQIDKQSGQAKMKSRAGPAPIDETNRTKHIGKTTTQNIDIDAETQTVIVQTIDEKTGSVIKQYPNEVQLSLRAYLSAAQAKAAPPVSISHSA
jgi:uncharacterized FlaG/YvyC family protein